MYQVKSLLSGKNIVVAFTVLFFVAIFAIGGCNDDNNGNGNGGGVGDPGPDTSACEVLSDPCSTVSKQPVSDPTYIECILDDTTCVVNIDNYITQIKNNGYNVSNDSVLWIGAYGGAGAASEGHGGGSIPGGYAQTTTSVADLKSANSGSAELFYFIAEDGPTGPDHCGGGGGAASIVTFEDLTLNPSSDPDSASVLLIGGGSGGASASRASGCVNGDGFEGGFGGIAVADTSGNSDNAGTGCQDSGFGCGSTSCGECIGSMGGSFIPQGGDVNTDCTDGTGCGGDRTCCLTKQTEPQNGDQGFGGRGGRGGQGVNCTQTGNAGFINASGFSFDAGKGGDGGGGDAACIAGGGGGGGGYGGGGAGGHGNDNTVAQPGAGGGSFAIKSTQSSDVAPTNGLNAPSSPCLHQGCIVINIVED